MKASWNICTLVLVGVKKIILFFQQNWISQKIFLREKFLFSLKA
jgi:hypothetical protein